MSTKPPAKKRKIPRRTDILSVLRKHDKPVSERALYQVFSLRKGSDRDAFIDRLHRMRRDGLVLEDRRGRFALPDRMDVVRGRVIGHAKGYGFLALESGGSDLFIPVSEMRTVLHGDRVLARVARTDSRGRKEVSVVEVLERANLNVVGRFVVEQGLGFVLPDDVRIGQDVFIPPDQYHGAESGQIVVAEIRRQPNMRSQPIGHIVELLGEHLAPGMEIEIAVRKFDLPYEWSDAVQSELHDLPAELSGEIPVDRWDIRTLPLVTIDGEDARDFDDAVFCERTAHGWRLIVAIADVSHFVGPGSALDQEASLRGNSIYFPDHVIPMLPEPLSNDLCSLKPDVDRQCFTCEISIDSQGNITSYKFRPGVMCSSARLTYTETALALSSPDAGNDFRLPELLPKLRDLLELSQVLRTRRQHRGTVDFDLPESRIVFNDERKIERIELVHRSVAHTLIEECMLAANVCAARLLTENAGPGIFRVHDEPDSGKVEDVRRFLGEFGLSLGGGVKPDARDYLNVVEHSRGKSYARIIQTALLRSMKQAIYSTDNKGHFALGFDHYTHFTSPIRRYPDLLVHRALRDIVLSIPNDYDEIDRRRMSDVVEHCSMTERRADDATREVVQWLKAEFMLDHVGDSFAGTVISVTDFGIFVEIDEFLIEGLVHITALGRDYFRFDSIAHRLVGSHTGRRYEIGDQLQVRVVRVDLDQAKIDLEPTGSDMKGNRRHGKRKTVRQTGGRKKYE